MPPQSIGGPANAAGCAKAVTGRAFPGIRPTNRAAAVCSAPTGERGCRADRRALRPRRPRAGRRRRLHQPPRRRLARRGHRRRGVAVDPGPLGAARAARRVRALRPELVHLQFAPSAFGFSPWIGLLPDAVGAPVVTTLHEYGWWSAPGWVPSSLWTPLERRVPVDRETWRLTPASAAVVTTNALHAAAVARRIGRADRDDPARPERARLRPRGCPRRPRAARDPGRRPGRRVLRLRPPGQRPALPDRGRRAAADAPPAPAPAPARRLHLARPARPRSPTPSATSWSAGRPSCGAADHRDDHRPPARRRGLGGPARRRRRRVPLHRGATTKSGALLSAFAHGLPRSSRPRTRRTRSWSTARRWSSPTACATPTRSSDRSAGCSTTPRCVPGWRRAAARWPWTARGRGSPPPTRSCTRPCGRPNMPPDDAADVLVVDLLGGGSATW